MFIKPCHGLITSLYDMHRKHPITGKILPHWGVDYGNHADNSIPAAAQGVVRFIGRGHKTAGNFIVIKHPNGWETAYLHLAAITVIVGQSVEQGQKIGVKGMTGGATGIHLHFEVSTGTWPGDYKNNVNPVLYIDDPDVRELQSNLNKLGYKLVVDGKYGEATMNAVINYQDRRNLLADGVPGLVTVASIKKDLPNYIAKEEPIMPEPNANVVSPSHKEAWEWAKEQGYLNGERPKDPLTREQFATVLKRMHDKLAE
ncbi:peptidoglycan DD-metalloendopeptidase family protein [Sporosarcina sp. Te-1]|uniref:peptidoglycan DD-metalloendopeptidase family protein n=1 Tax=Sporosarcina sp. Te-1 TaxID=2818390 RepID=UPI001A9D2AF9|nr:peptidoglycan DD-metalloendopeptidase family protein [Sporosarcina sp. Te-1]QTD42521.1 peptidoglycan DD-metalloendopeptidase family protein [Sporosarcina sp. Te-1]